MDPSKFYWSSVPAKVNVFTLGYIRNWKNLLWISQNVFNEKDIQDF